MANNYHIQSDEAESVRQRILRQMAERGYEVTGDEVVIPSFSDLEVILAAAQAAGRDPHKATALEMYGGDDVTPDQRRAGKTLNFPTMYGRRGKLADIAN